MSGLDWAAMMRAGLGAPALGGLGLRPAEFWALTPAELRLMLGPPPQDAPMRRARFEALCRAYPDDSRTPEGGTR